ncbi:hypothetical protein BDQ17DRAFT_684901 [Cyathus striatus]|nr:hypothetical protein BDQ17DRAFT_684901 [Cyathus striatus]
MVPPIHREGFSYYANQFYVQVGNNQHGRETPSHLYSLLTYVAPGPVLTKAGKVAKRQPRPHKDLPCHFYRAQLLHYGLSDLKTRTTQSAKKKLLAAFKDGQKGEKVLEVPSSILKLEEEMKVEWSKLNKEELKNGAKKATEKAEADCRDRVISQSILIRPKYYYSVLHESDDESDDDDNDESDDEDEDDSADPPGAKRGRDATSPKGQPAQKKQNSENLGILEACTGKFKVNAPSVSENYPELVSRHGQMIEFGPSLSGSHLWGRFDFGPVYGYIRSVGPAPTLAGEKIQFIWRGRERGEGEMIFGNYTKGFVTFMADGSIEGTMKGYVFEKAKFTGHRSSEATGYRAQVRDWKYEFRSLNEGAYNCASAGRWGKWVSNEGCTERPADSDTTDSDGARPDDSEDDNSGSDSDVEF